MLMNLLSRFGKVFSKNKVMKNSSQKSEEIGIVQKLVSLSSSGIHPSDFMEELSIGLAFDISGPISFSSCDIKLYSLISLDHGGFIGSFYGLFKEGKYYGYIVGGPDIICCYPTAFKFEETDELFIPLVRRGEDGYALIGRYNRFQGSLKPLRFIKVREPIYAHQECILHHFEENQSMSDAIKYCKEELEKL